MPDSKGGKLRIIFLEDEAKDFRLVEGQLEKARLPFELVRVESDRQFLEQLERVPDLILSDHHLPEFDGFAALNMARAKCPNVPFIFVTGAVTDAEAAEARRRGAVDIVLKNELAATLLPAITSALELVDERSKRQEAENALKESEDRYRRLLELLPCAVIVHQRGTIMVANAAAARLLGASRPQDLIGADVAKFVSPEYREKVRARIEQVEHGDTVPFLQEKLIRLDGALVDVEVAATPVALPDDPAPGVMVVAIDITERVQACDRIKQLNSELEDRVRTRTAELENAVRELEGFSYSVSHDLRAPLRHIDGFTELLLHNAGEKLDATSKEYLDIITGAARQMSNLIEALLAFSRLSRAPLNTQPVSLAQLLDGVLHDLRYETEGRKVEWQIALLPTVHGDATLLRQVLFNLLSNAVKYTRPRTVARIEVGQTHTPAEHIIYVKDNGVGFDMEFAGKLFGVFQRLHPSADFEGVGIGLANVRRIVQRHGGRTWAEAVPDQGATFYFSLPRTPILSAP
jgi:PAS domain S-box-containing protein